MDMSDGKAGPSIDPVKLAKALASPVRQELLAAFGRTGRATVKELAKRLGRTPHSLYYHLELLCRAGAIALDSVGGGIEEADSSSPRRSRPSPAATYSRVRRSFVMPAGRTKSLRKAQLKGVSAMLRLTDRDVRSALARFEREPKGKPVDFIALRAKARLDSKRRKAIRRLIEAIRRELQSAAASPTRSQSSGKSGDSRLLAITLVVTPCLDRQRTPSIEDSS